MWARSVSLVLDVFSELFVYLFAHVPLLHSAQMFDTLPLPLAAVLASKSK